MHLKSVGYIDTVLFPPTGKARDAVLPYFGLVSRISIADKFR